MCRRINFDLADNVQTPVAHEKDNFGEGIEGMGPLLDLKFKTEKRGL